MLDKSDRYLWWKDNEDNNKYLSFRIFVTTQRAKKGLPEPAIFACIKKRCEITVSKYFYCVKIFFAEIFNGGSALFKYWWWKDNEDNDK